MRATVILPVLAAWAILAAQGATWTVCASGCYYSNLQTAINNAASGDTLVLKAGESYTGNFVLPAKGGTSVITITSDQDGQFQDGVRVAKSDSTRMPKIVSSGASAAITAGNGASFYTLRGLEIVAAPNVYNSGLVILGDLLNVIDANYPSNITIDRCLLHGDAVAGAARAVLIAGKNIVVKNTYIYDAFSSIQDAQAVLVCNAPGPTAVFNNYLEGSTENMLIGGCPPDSPSPLAISSDVTVVNNLFFRQAWPGLTKKNMFEIKLGHRVLIEGNVFDANNVNSVTGFAVVFTSRAETYTGSVPSGEILDVVFQNNIIQNSLRGVNLLGSDSTRGYIGTARNFQIRNNLFKNVIGRGYMIAAKADQVVIDHNTNLEIVDMCLIFTDTGLPNTNFRFSNNITPSGVYGFFGDGVGGWQNALNVYAIPWSAPGNLFAGAWGGANLPGSYYPATVSDFGVMGAPNYRLRPGSTYKGLGSDGQDPGINQEALELRLAATSPTMVLGIQPTATGAVLHYFLHKDGDCTILASHNRDMSSPVVDNVNDGLKGLDRTYVMNGATANSETWVRWTCGQFTTTRSFRTLVSSPESGLLQLKVGPTAGLVSAVVDWGYTAGALTNTTAPVPCGSGCKIELQTNRGGVYYRVRDESDATSGMPVQAAAAR